MLNSEPTDTLKFYPPLKAIFTPLELAFTHPRQNILGLICKHWQLLRVRVN